MKFTVEELKYLIEELSYTPLDEPVCNTALREDLTDRFIDELQRDED